MEKNIDVKYSSLWKHNYNSIYDIDIKYNIKKFEKYHATRMRNFLQTASKLSITHTLKITSFHPKPCASAGPGLLTEIPRRLWVLREIQPLHALSRMDTAPFLEKRPHSDCFILLFRPHYSR